MEASGVRLGTPAGDRCADSTRTTCARWGEIIAGALAPGPRISNRSADRSDALCEKRPLYPGFRGYTTYQA
jgi:hypothetical protein